MSTLKATNIKNESSASNNIVLDSGGGVVVSGILTATTFSGNVTGNVTGNVSGNITIGAGSTSAPSLAPSGDSNTGVFFPSADTIAFAEGGTEVARFDSSGRLLVGTTSARSNIYMGGASDTPKFQFESSGNDYSGQLSLIQYTSVGTAPTYTLGISKSNTPGANAVVASGDTLGVVNFVGNDGTNFRSAAQIIGSVDTTPGSNDMPGRLSFFTTSDGTTTLTERMRINSNGTAGFFNASDTIWGASSNSAGTTHAIYVGSHSASGVYGGSVSYKVYTNGNVQNSNGSYTAFSDAKLKENIVDASSQWDDIKSIRIRNWNFKEETGYETHRQIGPIAQELEQVCPGLVFDTPDRDEEGNDLGTVTKGVNQSVLYMKAIKALQEAQERIETLEAQNAAILARLDAAGI